MRFHVSAALGTLVVLLAMTTVVVSAVDLEQYRDFRLGSSTALVAKAAGTTQVGELQTLHARPALIQELQWRPPYRPEQGAGLDPVRDVVFRFVDDQLFQMLVTYERSRTEGLTAADMIAAITSAYGPVERGSAVPSGPVGYAAVDTATVLATWRNEGSRMALQHYDYGGGYSLVITSVALEQRARTATASAVAIDKTEAPAREAARLKSQGEASRDAAERTRSVNKGGFKP
jgi:hypothetical protein